MCDPVTIIGAIATAGGMAANMSAQSKVANARKDVMAAERIRQQGFDHETDALNAHSQNLYEGAGDKQAATATKLGEMFTGGGTPQAPAAAQEQSLIPASSSSIVTQNEAKDRAGAKAYTDQQGMALGNFKAFGDLMGGLGRDQSRDAGYIGQIGGFKRGSSNIMPLELEDANSAGDGMKMFGDILSGVGKLGISAGLSGGFGGGGGMSAAQTSILNDPLGMSAPSSAFSSGLPTFAAGKTGGFTAPFNIGAAGLSLPTFARGKNPFSPY